MQYLKEEIIIDQQGEKHHVWVRNGLLTSAELCSKNYLDRYSSGIGRDGLIVWSSDLEEVFQYRMFSEPVSSYLF